MKSSDRRLNSGIINCRLRVTDNIRRCKQRVIDTLNSIIQWTFTCGLWPPQTFLVTSHSTQNTCSVVQSLLVHIHISLGQQSDKVNTYYTAVIFFTPWQVHLPMSHPVTQLLPIWLHTCSTLCLSHHTAGNLRIQENHFTAVIMTSIFWHTTKFCSNFIVMTTYKTCLKSFIRLNI